MTGLGLQWRVLEVELETVEVVGRQVLDIVLNPLAYICLKVLPAVSDIL
jgi:hypothetical protein